MPCGFSRVVGCKEAVFCSCSVVQSSNPRCLLEFQIQGLAQEDLVVSAESCPGTCLVTSSDTCDQVGVPSRFGAVDWESFWSYCLCTIFGLPKVSAPTVLEVSKLDLGMSVQVECHFCARLGWAVWIIRFWVYIYSQTSFIEPKRH